MKKNIITTTKIFIVGLSVLPTIVWAEETPGLQDPLGNPDIWQFLARLAGGLNFVTGTLALVFIVLGGYRILIAGGNSENFEKGKKMILYSFLGLVLTVSSYTILATTISIISGGQPTGFTTGPLIVFDPINIAKVAGSPAVELYGRRVLGFLLGGLGSLTTLMFVYSGFLWMTAGGSEEKITKAKKTLLYAVIGVLVVLSSYIFLNFAYVPFYRLIS
jgi:hypothetical protein